MRPRFAMLGCLLAALAVMGMPGLSGAAPHHNRGLTINATPNPVDAGEGVLIYGQLEGTDIAGKTIVLYHHVNGSAHPGYQVIGQTQTDSHGFYEFTRAEGVVLTNRSWFTRLGGTPSVHSRTVHERVAALVSIASSTSSPLTRHAVIFTGHVDPNHRFQRVLLQEQRGSSDDWTTLKAGRLGPGSNYSIRYAWRTPDEHTVRVVFPGDNRNIRGVSDPLAVTVEQAQVADFTINTSDPVINYGQTATITGKLYHAGTTTPEPNTAITLCHRAPGQAVASCDVAGKTGGDGGYSFLVSPATNQLYYVKTTLPPNRRSATLFEGVKDTLTLGVSSPGGTVGQTAIFSGRVTPDKAGDFVYLQRFGADGDWHTIAVSRVQPDSSFAFAHTYGTPGTKTFRARILSDGENVGGASAPVSVNVTLPPVSLLPPGA